MGRPQELFKIGGERLEILLFFFCFFFGPEIVIDTISFYETHQFYVNHCMSTVGVL